MKKEITNRLDDLGIKYCFNEQHYDYKKLKYIIVGDNPGVTEYKENRFFIGSSGKVLRNHFISNKLIKDFDNECIIFNKTFIHTAKTKELEVIKKEIGIELFNAIQLACAKEIAEISNEHNIPILIFGKSQLSSDLLFASFWKGINEFTHKKEHILVFNHPSYNNFLKEWTKYKNEFLRDSPEQLLKHIGLKNTEKLKSKYTANVLT
jgi:hypothetical protein